VWAAQEKARRKTRRARKKAAAVAGPVSPIVYAEIRAEGECVYCGGPSEMVEHITPLARGGLEHLDNLVPACGPCNLNKGDKLLREWRPDRVAYGVRVSLKVAAAYARQLMDSDRAAAG
jgi:5-methylcytosine-specific restriction endonuclease McrA